MGRAVQPGTLGLDLHNQMFPVTLFVLVPCSAYVPLGTGTFSSWTLSKRGSSQESTGNNGQLLVLEGRRGRELIIHTPSFSPRPFTSLLLIPHSFPQ